MKVQAKFPIKLYNVLSNSHHSIEMARPKDLRGADKYRKLMSVCSQDHIKTRVISTFFTV